MRRANLRASPNLSGYGRSLALAVAAGTRGGTLPAVLNAANEIAVAAFLDRRIRFPQIWEIVARAMDKCPHADHPDLEQLLETDRSARELASRLVVE